VSCNNSLAIGETFKLATVFSIPGYRSDFETRAAKLSVFGWDDDHHPGFKNRPILSVCLHGETRQT